MTDFRDAALQAAEAMEAKRAEDVVVLDVGRHTPVADYFVIGSAQTTVQIRAVVDAVEDALTARGVRLVNREGDAQARWVLLDFGAVVDGYASDLTRTVVVGKATARQKKIYRIVRQAQKRGISSARAGIAARDLDAKARGYIARSGLGNYFQHGLGHGLGLEVHQLPGINSRSTEKLKAGMVVTIEPGIYLPRWGGVRIEDDVLITNGGCRVLTTAERNLLEL